MRTVPDAYLSLKQYVHEVLGDEWEVRIADDDGSFKTPFAMVSMVGPTLYGSMTPMLDLTQPFAVHCYPAPQGSMSDSRVAALMVEERIHTGFLVGVGLGRPRRVPLWDFQGKTLLESSDKRGRSDYMRVDDISINRVPDAADDQRITVRVDVRVSWRRTGRVPSEGKTVESVRIESVYS